MEDFFSKLRPASFRGFSFDVSEDSKNFGRRVATHQFPGKDEPYHEDFGADVDKFNVQAVISGADFLEKALNFENILKQGGAGTLIHPYYGEIQVVVLSSSRRHSHRSVGEVRFTITFEKDYPSTNPNVGVDTSAALTQTSLNAFEAIQKDFADNFTSLRMPDFILNDALTRISDFKGILNTALNQVGMLRVLATELPIIQDVSDAAAVAGEITGIFDNVANIFKPFPVPAISISNYKTSTDSSGAIQVVKALVSTGIFSVLTDDEASTAVSATRIKNAEAIDILNKFSSLSGAVQASKFVSYESREQALETRDLISNNLFAVRDILGAKGWDKSWREAGNLVSVLNRDINERIGRLPRTAVVYPNGVQSSLRLAHRLYGDDLPALFSNAEDLASRNNIRHPGFMPADRLEVLINEA